MLIQLNPPQFWQSNDNKMSRLFLGFLLILLINKPTSSFEIFGITIEDIKIVYEYVNQVYMKTEELQESPTLEVANEKVAFHEIMTDLKGLSQQLVHIQNDEDVKLDTIVRVLLDNMDVSNDLQASKTQLINHLNYIEYMYQKGLTLVSGGEFSADDMSDFTSRALRGSKSLEETVSDLYSLFFPGRNSLLRLSFQSLSLSFVEANYERLCDKLISAQQRMYYIFMIIIDSHLKAFSAITQAYSLRLSSDSVSPSKYQYEYGLLKLMFHDQLTSYFEEFTRIIRYFPRDIRRCEVSEPKMGENILQFEGLFQVVVNTESEIRKKLHMNMLSLNYASGTCEDIKSDEREQFVIYDCKTVDSIRGCPVVNANRILRFSWWKTAVATSGHAEECPVKMHEILGSNAGWFYNDVCTCSVNYTDAPLLIYNLAPHTIEFEKPKIMKISVEPQMSDVKNNMIVVGVKFIVHDSAIHLQIQQSKLTRDNVPTDGIWKPVNVDNDNKTISIHYDFLFDRRNIIHLDDIGVDPKYVVTGVRLQRNKEGNGFELNVHGTEIFMENRTLGTSQMWYKPGDFPNNPNDYQEKRSEIHLHDPDDPSLISDYHPDPRANKFVQLQHTSITKDGGYHTVPFIEAEPVTVSMHSPLSGIGLFYRHREGYGGYIAPRLFTYDHAHTLEVSIKKWKEFDKLYRQCYEQTDIIEWHHNCTSLGLTPRGNTSSIGTAVNHGLRPDLTTVTPRHESSSKVVEVLPSNFPGAHSNMNPTPTSIDKHNSTNSNHHSAHQTGPPAGTLWPENTYSSTVQSTNTSETLLSSIGPSYVIQDHFTNTGSQNRSDMYRRRLRKIERPLKVLRRNKSSIIYICDSNVMSYDPSLARSGFSFSVNSHYSDDNSMSNSIPMIS